MTNTNIKIVIERDELPEDPREWDNLSTMLFLHRRYSLGDKNAHNNLKELIINSPKYRPIHEELLHDPVEAFELALKLDLIADYLPVYMYDHSGIVLSTTAFSCPWDSGHLGYMFVSKEDARKEFSVKRISPKLKERLCNIMEAELTTYNMYVQCDTYQYTIYENGKEDTYCGFYGSDLETNGMLDHIGHEHRELVQEAFDNMY